MLRVIKFDPWRLTRQGPALKGLCFRQYHFISVKLILKTPLKNLSDHGAAIASNNCKTQNIKKLVSSQINSNNTFSHSEHVFYTNSKLTWLSSCFNWGIQTPYGHMQCRNSKQNTSIISSILSENTVLSSSFIRNIYLVLTLGLVWRAPTLISQKISV